jgi:hypothetical protein
MLDMRVLVVGMPNVGISLGSERGRHINAPFPCSPRLTPTLRRALSKDVTRKLAGVVKIHRDPTVYVYDTPGVMVPFLGHGR